MAQDGNGSVLDQADGDQPAPGTATPSSGRRNTRPYGAYLAIATAALFLVVGAVVRVSLDDDPAAGQSDGTAQTGLAGTVLGEPWARPSFTLTTTEGDPFDFATETAGRTTLLFFGYTSCPDICPIHLSTLAAALRQPQVPNPLVVFVGVDHGRDTPSAVRAYLDQFDPQFVGLVGSAEELEAAQRATGVPIATIGEVQPDGDYLVGHAGQIMAYTPDDLAHVVYPFGARRQDWVNDLPRLASIDWSEHGH